MKKFNLLLKTVLIASPLLILASCDSNEKENTQTNLVEESVETATPVFYKIPSPLQVASIFQRSELGFNKSLLNSVNNVTKYNTLFSKTLALGSYSANANYCTINQQFSEAYPFVKVIKDLTDGVGLSSVLETQNFFERYEANLENEDSLLLLVTDIQIEFDTYFQDNEQAHFSVVLFYGAWIESIYFATQTLENTLGKSQLSKLYEQYIILQNIIKTIEANENEDSVEKIYTELKELKAAFDAVPYFSNNEEIESLAKADLVGLTNIISEKRSKVVNNEW